MCVQVIILHNVLCVTHLLVPVSSITFKDNKGKKKEKKDLNSNADMVLLAHPWGSCSKDDSKRLSASENKDR